MRMLATGALVGLLGFAVGSASAEDDFAKKIVGTWVVDKSEDLPDNAVAEFTKDGKVTLTAKVKDKDVKMEGTYKVEKDKLITKLTFNKKTTEDTDEILKLTDDVMELRDKDKKVSTFKKKK